MANDAIAELLPVGSYVDEGVVVNDAPLAKRNIGVPKRRVRSNRRNTNINVHAYCLQTQGTICVLAARQIYSVLRWRALLISVHLAWLSSFYKALTPAPLIWAKRLRTTMSMAVKVP